MSRAGERIFLDPKRKLLDAATDWLLTRLRLTPEGAKSLDHLLVVMPTAQSGRALRLALAQRLAPAGLLPPRIVQPMDLVVPAEDAPREATETEIAALFLKFIEQRPRRRTEGGAVTEVLEWTHLFRPEAFSDRNASFSLLDQLLDIWRILCGEGLLMREVAENPEARQALEEAQGDELLRWQELGELETCFFAFLHEHGLRAPAEGVHRAKQQARAIPEAVEEVVLPALADPMGVLYDVLEQQRETLAVTVLLHATPNEKDRFDRWGRPIPEAWTGDRRPVLEGLTEEDIDRTANSTALAQNLVADFIAAAKDEAVFPTLALCDENLFPELSAAFLSANFVVQNPERNLLAISSLGRLVRVLLEAWREPSTGISWKTFSALLRSDDVMRALAEANPTGDPDRMRAEALAGMDAYQNRFLPAFLPNDFALPPGLGKRDQREIEPFVKAACALLALLAETRASAPALPDFLRAFLRRIFAAKALGGTEGEKEFREAAACVWNILDALAGETIVGLRLPDGDLLALARRMLDAAAYSLEAETSDAIRTEGWLELAWSAGDRLALAGLHEGAVPDSVVGHAFLPNTLRAALRLGSNARRLARDTWLLKELVDSHAPHCVRAYVARANDAGDICRPSRLLFLCRPEDLARRTSHLFGDLGEPSLTPPRKMAKDWRLRLPDEAPLPNGHLTASAIGTYLTAPLLYLLQCALGMEKSETKSELGFNDFGSLVHRILEKYAAEQLAATARGEDQLSACAAIAERLEHFAQETFASYGPNPSLTLRLQFEAVRRRLANFAPLQAEWAAEGWRVAEKPEFSFCVKPFPDLEVEVKGSVDRIDGRTLADGSMEYRIIDYKTWDEVKSAPKHVQASTTLELEFAKKLGLPVAPLSERKNIRLRTVQLPLYGRCVEMKSPEKYAGRVTDYCYLVLGKDAENVKAVGTIYPSGCGRLSRSALQIAPFAPLALATAHRAAELILANVFWPPRPSEFVKFRDFDDLFLVSPEKDFLDEQGQPCAWLARQIERLEALS